ncbi:MAG TPA: condensation domain-containing protein, partial [Pseudonocardiaceae bacterium]
PRTRSEEVLASVYAEVLGLERVGLDDDFFVVGGDSIRSIQVVTRARARGVEVTPREVFERRTVAELAEAAVARSRAGASPAIVEPADGGIGWMPLPPVGAYLMGLGGGVGRFAMSMVVELPVGIDSAGLAATLTAVLDRHDVLRSRLVTGRDGHGLMVDPPGSRPAAALVHRVACDGRWESADWRRTATAELDAATGRLDPGAGVMVQVVWFDAGPSVAGRAVLVLHHLVVDGVSWRILLPDLAAAWARVRTGAAPELPPVPTSVRRWAHALADEAVTPRRVAELPFWQRVLDGPDPVLGRRRPDPDTDTMSTLGTVRVEVPAAVTEALLTTLPAVFHGGVNDGLLAALAMAVARWRAGRGVIEPSVLVRLEGHGREEGLVPGADLSRTVGWFTSMFPVRLDVSGVDLDAAFAAGPAAGDVVRAVKEQLLAVPDKGIGHGLLRHLNPATAEVLAASPEPQLGFNYLGRYSATTDMPRELRGLGWAQAMGVDDLAAAPDPDLPALSAVEISSFVTDTADGPRLAAEFAFPTGVLTTGEVRELADLWCAALSALAGHVDTPGAGGRTPSDLPLVTVGQAEIRRWEARYPGLTDVWPLTPLQSGLLFHSLLHDSGADVYQVQLVVHLSGPVEAARMRAAGQGLLGRHANLRAAFVPDAAGGWVQVVSGEVGLPWREVDLRGVPEADRAAAVERLLAEDRAVRFDPAVPPLLRLLLVRLAEDRCELVLTAHHVLFD